jgi:ribosome recycling factor
MSYQEILEKIKPNLENIVDSFKGEIAKIHPHRISPNLIEDIKVECFDSILPIKQLGVISHSSPRELALQLWDKSYLTQVTRAIEKENLGLSIRIEENTIYLSAPPLSKEQRENLIRVLNQKKEEAFREVRRLRDKAWKEIQEGFQKGEIREDDKYKGKEKLEETIREYRGKIEQISENKEKEISG